MNDSISILIFLCGFMGAGKSYFLNKLKCSSEVKGLNRIDDLDIIIEIKVKMSIKEFIEKSGLEKFRKLETECLRDILKQNKQSGLISLGGGALERENISLLEKYDYTKLVWLNTPFETCFKRIENDKSRPLAKLGKIELLKLYNGRIINYAKADLKLDMNMQQQINTFDELVALF